jgi:hypothetical protein
VASGRVIRKEKKSNKIKQNQTKSQEGGAHKRQGIKVQMKRSLSSVFARSSTQQQLKFHNKVLKYIHIYILGTCDSLHQYERKSFEKRTCRKVITREKKEYYTCSLVAIVDKSQSVYEDERDGAIFLR